MSNWISAISVGLRKTADQVPKGWKTIIDISKEIDKSESHTAKIVRDMKERGLVDTQTFKLLRDGKLRNVPHYKLKN
jgi:hypothetical protein